MLVSINLTRGQLIDVGRHEDDLDKLEKRIKELGYDLRLILSLPGTQIINQIVAHAGNAGTPGYQEAELAE